MEGFPHIWRYISPFQVFGAKDTLFNAYSTYLDANSSHEEVPCNIVGTLKGKAFAYEHDNGIMDPLHAFKGKRSKMFCMKKTWNMLFFLVNILGQTLGTSPHFKDGT